jgi:hypothetical protein
MDIKQVNSAIMFGTWTDIELRSMIDAVKWNRAQLTQQTKRSLTIGDHVQFTSTKNGVRYAGTVQKIAIKYVTVSTAKGQWRVPANMLTKINEPEFA